MSIKLSNAYHNLALQLDAGVPIVKAFGLCARGIGGRVARAMKDIQQQISEGTEVSQAMERHRSVFDPLDRTIMGVAERTGMVGECAGMLSNWHQMLHRLNSKIKGGLILPMLNFHAGALLISFSLSIFNAIDPNGGMFSLSGLIGPMFRRFLMIILCMDIPLVAVWAIYQFTPKQGPLRLLLDRFVSLVPILSGAIRQLTYGRFFRTFHMMYKAGIPITDAISVSCALAGNQVFVQHFNGSIDAVQEGKEASEGFSWRFPEEYRAAWEVGEESGQLEKVTDRLAAVALEKGEIRVQRFVTVLVRLIYFLVMIAMAVMVLIGFGRIYGGMLSGV